MKALQIFAFAILLPVLAYHPDRPSADQARPDDQMYEIYSATIRELFLKGSDDTKSREDLGARLVVIKDHTIQYPWQEWDDPTKRALTWAKNGIVVGKRTLED